MNNHQKILLVTNSWRKHKNVRASVCTARIDNAYLCDSGINNAYLCDSGIENAYLCDSGIDDAYLCVTMLICVTVELTRVIPQFTDTSDTDTFGLLRYRYRVPIPGVIWWQR